MLRKQKMVLHNIFCAIIAREDELVYLKPSQNSVLSQRRSGGRGGGGGGGGGIGLTLKRCFLLLVPAAFVDSNIFETTTEEISSNFAPGVSLGVAQKLARVRL